VTDEPDSQVFEYLAAALMQDLQGKFTEKLTGIDEAYWDLQVEDDTIVLQLQHYLGIMIHPAGLSKATDGERRLLVRAFEIIAKESET
jgi:hypothetical protein